MDWVKKALKIVLAPWSRDGAPNVATGSVPKRGHTGEPELSIDEDDIIALSVDKATALVLCDILSRWEDQGSPDTVPFEHLAEKFVLWKVLGALETKLDEIYSPNYGEIIAEARAKLVQPS